MFEPPTDAGALATTLKALSDPKRLQILNLLIAGVQCNCELGEHLEMAPNLISHHLRLLRQAGLVSVEKDATDGRWLYYSVNRTALEALNIAFAAFFDPARIEPRRPACGPKQPLVPLAVIDTTGIAYQPENGNGATYASSRTRPGQA
jgi:ArsR family transcriptional regulator